MGGRYQEQPLEFRSAEEYRSQVNCILLSTTTTLCTQAAAVEAVRRRMAEAARQEAATNTAATEVRVRVRETVAL